jgi:hypothetical protein
MYPRFKGRYRIHEYLPTPPYLKIPAAHTNLSHAEVMLDFWQHRPNTDERAAEIVHYLLVKGLSLGALNELGISVY